MCGTSRYRLLAVALAAALLLPGCELMAPPLPLKPAENVGVDPTGETLDTSTVPPEGEETAEPPLTAALRRRVPPRAPRRPAPAPAPTQETTSPSSGLEKTYVAPGLVLGQDDVRVGSAERPASHRHKKSSGGLTPGWFASARMGYKSRMPLPERPTIGFIGLGVMGHSMAGHLLEAGYPLVVFTRTAAKARRCSSAGRAVGRDARGRRRAVPTSSSRWWATRATSRRSTSAITGCWGRRRRARTSST